MVVMINPDWISFKDVRHAVITVARHLEDQQAAKKCRRVTCVSCDAISREEPRKMLTLKGK